MKKADYKSFTQLAGRLMMASEGTATSAAPSETVRQVAPLLADASAPHTCNPLITKMIVRGEAVVIKLPDPLSPGCPKQPRKPLHRGLDNIK